MLVRLVRFLIDYTVMKKSTAFSSLLLLGGFGSLGLLVARLRSLDLHFSLRGEDAAHYG